MASSSEAPAGFHSSVPGCRGVGAERADGAGDDEAPALRRAWSAFVGMPAVHHNGGAVEFGLQEFLVGIILYRGRHGAAGIGDHPVGGDDGVAFNAMRSAHAPQR